MLNRMKSSGFTIVELAIVIVVIAILAIVTVASFDSVQERAHESVTASNVELYVSALEQISQDTGRYPEVMSLGSVCLGAQTSSYCTSGALSYSGAGCGDADGLFLGGNFDTGVAVNAELAKYLDDLPDPSTISSIKSTISVTTEEGVCRVVLDTDGSVLYSSGKYVEYRQDGGVGFWRQIGSGEENTRAYRITYVVPGDAECHYRGAIKDYDTNFDATTCSIYGGETVYE